MLLHYIIFFFGNYKIHQNTSQTTNEKEGIIRKNIQLAHLEKKEKKEKKILKTRNTVENNLLPFKS